MSKDGWLVEGTEEYERAKKQLDEACSGSNCYCVKDFYNE